MARRRIGQEKLWGERTALTPSSDYIVYLDESGDHSTWLNGGLKRRLTLGGMFGVAPRSLIAARAALVS